jgi:membrane-associated protein
MDFLTSAFEAFLHIDRHLLDLSMTYGAWIYAILFLIVFFETGVVVTPFLPGDSLLFATGALAAAGVLDLGMVLALLTAAAIIGDNMNYWIGRGVGPRVFSEGSRLLKREYLLQTKRYYEKHGGKTVVLARFMPIIRTFSPFVAGIGRMSYPRFLAFDVGGGIFWVCAFTLLGYFFGNVPIVKQNFGLVIVAVILLSIVPIFIEVLRSRSERV